MTRLNATKLIAILSILTVQSAAFSHEKSHDSMKTHSGRGSSELAAEQKPWGIAAQPRAVTRTVTVRMLDNMRFEPDHLSVRLGETVRIKLLNQGKVLHEMVLGTGEELDAHAALMQKFPDMEHDEPHMAHVRPGRSGDIVWRFNRLGEFKFACLIAGHYQAGMTGRITVKPQ